MSEKRTAIGRFIKNSWTNMNIRCGKYKHLRTEDKCKSYEDIKVTFTREDYKIWCYKNKELIESLSRPSLDRIDSNGNYSLDNIQVIELIANIKQKRPGDKFKVNSKYKNTIRGIRQTSSGKFSARITYNGVEKYLGSFETQDEALNEFHKAYKELHNCEPFEI